MTRFDFNAQVESARANGFSLDERPAAAIASCGVPCSTALYEPCDLKQISIELSKNEVVHNVVVDRPRKHEAPQEGITAAIRRHLSAHDIVLEAVAPFRDETVQDGIAAPTDSVAPLSIGVEATEVYMCGNGMHPTAALSGSQSDDDEIFHGPTRAIVWARAPANLFRGSRWGRLWPFGDDRTTAVVVSGVTWGINPDQDPIGRLSAAILVMPDDNWRLTLGRAPKVAGSVSLSRTTQDRQKIGDRREDATVYTRSKTRRGLTTTSAEPGFSIWSPPDELILLRYGSTRN